MKSKLQQPNIQTLYVTAFRVKRRDRGFVVGYQKDKLNQTEFIFCIYQITCTMTHVSEPILKKVLILILKLQSCINIWKIVVLMVVI